MKTHALLLALSITWAALADDYQSQSLSETFCESLVPKKKIPEVGWKQSARERSEDLALLQLQLHRKPHRQFKRTHNNAERRLLKHQRGIRSQASRTREEHRGENVTMLFYMYEDTSLIDGVPAHLRNNFKVFPDFAIYDGLKNHPWRTLNAEEADIFFVPGSLSAVASEWPIGNKWWDAPAGEIQQRLEHLAQTVLSSPYYHRNGGRDHFIAGHCWQVEPESVGPMGPIIKTMWVLADDKETRNLTSLMTIPVPYGDAFDDVPELDVRAPKKFHDRQHSLNFVGQASSKIGYNERRAAITNISRVHVTSTLVCVGTCDGYTEGLRDCSLTDQDFTGCKSRTLTHGEYARLLRDARFCLMLPGDTSSSGRLYDCISAGVIPIIISRPFAGGFWGNAAPFLHDLPWDDFSFSVTSEVFMANPAGSISNITSLPAKIIEQKLSALQAVRSSLDWMPPDGLTKVPTLTLLAVRRSSLDWVPSTGIIAIPADFLALPQVKVTSGQAGLLQQGSEVVRTGQVACNELLEHLNSSSAFIDPFWKEVGDPVTVARLSNGHPCYF
jgi:hypothetical protein